MLDTLPSVSASEVLKIHQAIPPKSSPLDFILTSLIKSCSSVLSDFIANLANLSIRQGVFPSKFKTAQVTPLLKKAGLPKDVPGNYCPISNLNNISKILERLILNPLTAK